MFEISNCSSCLQDDHGTSFAMLSILHYFDLVPRSRFGGSKTKKGGGGEGKGEEEKEIWQNTIAWVRTVAMATVVSQHAFLDFSKNYFTQNCSKFH